MSTSSDTTELSTMKQIEEVESTAARVLHRGRMLDARVVDLWVERAPVDPDHPLHVKPGGTHWHLWISADHQDPGTADNPFSMVRDAADDLSALAHHLSEYADTLEGVRDALHELDGLEAHEIEDGARLMAKIIELGNNIKEAARVRNLANRVTGLANDARMVADWAFVPPSRRPVTYARHDMAHNTRLLRQRLNGVIARINTLGEHTNGGEGGGFRVVECTEAGCEIAADAQAELDAGTVSTHLCDEECGDDSHPRDGRVVPEGSDPHMSTASA